MRGRTPSRLGRVAAATFVAAGVALLAACSRTASGPDDAKPAAPRNVRTVAITGDDTMQFSELTLTASPGEALRVVFTNTGTRPKESMGHNWVLLRPASAAEVNDFGLAAAAAAPTYLPADRRSQIIVATKMLGPGESDAVEFTVPSKPAEYPYLCTFPGHFAMMRGWLVVK